MLVDEIARKVSEMFDTEVTAEDLIETLEENNFRTMSIVKEVEIERQKLRDKSVKELRKIQKMYRVRADIVANENNSASVISEFYCNTIANEAMALIVGYE